MKLSKSNLKLSKSVLIFSILLLSLSSCLKHKSIEPVEIIVVDTTTFPCGDTVFFSTEIMGEILTPSCNTTGCHNSTSAASGYDFSTYSNVNTNVNIILDVIQHNNGVSAMPQGANKLSDSLITKFDCWMQQGQLNN